MAKCVFLKFEQQTPMLNRVKRKGYSRLSLTELQELQKTTHVKSYKEEHRLKVHPSLLWQKLK